MVFHIQFWEMGLDLCFGGAKPTKAPTRGDGNVWKNSSLLFNAIDSGKCLGYAIRQACKICQTISVYKHDRAQSSTMHSGSAYPAS